MHRIDNATAAAVLPTPAAVGTPGFFTNGDPVGGAPATVVDDDWANAVQEELIAILAAAGVTPDKTERDQVLQALQLLLGRGRRIATRYFTTPGTSTYTPTAGTQSVEVLVQGGGGAGGGTPATGVGENAQSGNGGSGSYAIKHISAAFSGVTITVAAGGTGVSGNVGNSGGTSSFGSLLSAGGGNGGGVAGPTNVDTYVLGQIAPAAIPTLGDLNVAGTLPNQAFRIVGNAISPTLAATIFGFSYGYGGAGASPSGASTGAKVGGAGGGGIVIVKEYS